MGYHAGKGYPVATVSNLNGRFAAQSFKTCKPYVSISPLPSGSQKNSRDCQFSRRTFTVAGSGLLSSGAIRTIRGVGPLGHMLPSPDGRFVVGRESEKTLAIVSLIDERKISIPLAHSTTPVRWIDDRTIILEQDDSVPIQLERLNIQSQEITPFAAIPLTDNAGFAGRSNILLSADLRTYAFSCFQTLSDLYVVDGWR